MCFILFKLLDRVQFEELKKMTLFQVEIYVWCNRSSTKSFQQQPILAFLNWKLASLSLIFKFCRYSKMFESGYPKKQVLCLLPIREENFQIQWFAKAVLTLMSRYKFCLGCRRIRIRVNMVVSNSLGHTVPLTMIILSMVQNEKKKSTL